MRILLLGFFILLANYVEAQIWISGSVKDVDNRPIGQVSITFKKPGTSSILGFGKTDTNGKFNLNMGSDKLDSLRIEFNHLSYSSQFIVVPFRQGDYSIIMEPAIQQIKEVELLKTPIYQKQDTIHYDVGTLASAYDRVILDVIKKLPGIEIEGDVILYKGKPIQKYMVNNLDLMEGRYGLINNNLPADAVRKIQLIENDQPIKILDSLISSDQTSLNLELKKFSSVGMGQLGLGIEPLLWDVNITPITLGKTFQMINSVQSNNIGKDAAKELAYNYTSIPFSTNTAATAGPQYTSIRETIIPNFEEKRWLDNQVFLVTSHILKKLADGTEIKAGLTYHRDLRESNGFRATEYIVGNETINQTESVDNQYNSEVLEGGFVFEKNEKDVFIQNQLRYRNRWKKDEGMLNFNQLDTIQQQQKHLDQMLSNHFSMARFIGKHLVHFRSGLNIHETPQSLNIHPGSFQEILNDDQPFSQLSQEIVYKRLQWNNGIGFGKNIGNWVFSPDLFLDYERDRMQSKIIRMDSSDTITLGNPYVNNTISSALGIGLNLGVEWKRNRWKMNAKLPYSGWQYSSKQLDSTILNGTKRHIFDPSLNLAYQLNYQQSLTASVSRTTRYGGLENFYTGYILTQYQTMKRNQSRLLESTTNSSSINYNFKNPLKATFLHAGYRFLSSQRDYIMSTHIDQVGRLQIEIQDRPAKTENHEFMTSASKRFMRQRTTLKLTGNLRWSQGDYLLNNTIRTQYIQHRAAELSAHSELSKYVSGYYSIQLEQRLVRFDQRDPYHFFTNNHLLELVSSPHPGHSIHLNQSLFNTNNKGQRTQYFVDIRYRYKIPNSNVELLATGTNLLNNTHYTQQLTSEIEIAQTYFELRPRQAILAVSIKW